MGPAGPMTRRMFAVVRLAGSMSRSKVMSTALLVLLRTRLSVALGLAAGLKATLVSMTCGPGMISGSVSWLYGSNNAVDITFDRDMDPASLTTANILRVI